MNPTGSPSALTELWAKLQEAQPPRRTAVQLSRYGQVGTGGAIKMEVRSICILFLSSGSLRAEGAELRHAELRHRSTRVFGCWVAARVGRALNGACEEGIPRESRGDLEEGVKTRENTIFPGEAVSRVTRCTKDHGGGQRCCRQTPAGHRDPATSHVSARSAQSFRSPEQNCSGGSSA